MRIRWDGRGFFAASGGTYAYRVIIHVDVFKNLLSGIKVSIFIIVDIHNKTIIPICCVSTTFSI